MPYEATFWMARADMTLFDMKMWVSETLVPILMMCICSVSSVSLLSRFSRFYRSVNDSQTAALCLNKKNQVSRSVLSKSSGTASSTSPRASRSKSQSPQTGFNNLDEIFRRDQKKILANLFTSKILQDTIWETLIKPKALSQRLKRSWSSVSKTPIPTLKLRHETFSTPLRN